MIRVNLLKEEIDNSKLYMVQGIAYLALMGLAFGACTFLVSAEKSKITELESEKSKLDGQIAKLKKDTEKVEGLEEKKVVLKQKLMTISLLKAKKYGPVRVLDDLNLSIPERSWLMAVTEKDSRIEIDGVALDDQTVSDFMMKLEESEYFSDVDLIQSREHEKDGVLLRDFTLTAALVNKLELNGDGENKDSSDEPNVPGMEGPEGPPA